MPEHKARQYSDQLHCHICGKQWDVNDPEPPECINEETPPERKRRVTKKDARKRQTRRRIEELREQLKLGRDY
jgi:diadenosine tetraphosphate (Ap4A) HIT family hydrolase